MPSTADEQIEAIRVVLGRPKNERSLQLMERWLNGQMRDWRRTDDGGNVVVEFVLHRPTTGQHLRQAIANSVSRWGFFRQPHCRDNFRPMSIEQYMQGPIGELMRGRVQAVLKPPISEFLKGEQEKAEHHKLERAKELEPGLQRLVALLEKLSKPVLRESVKRLWNNAAAKLNAEAYQRNPGRGCIDHVPPKKRRLAKAGFEQKDRYRADNGVHIYVG